MLAGAFERFHHRNPFERFFTDVEYEGIPVGGDEVLRIPSNTVAPEERSCVSRWFDNCRGDVDIIEEPLDRSPFDKALVQAALRIDIVVLQIEEPQLRVVPVETVAIAIETAETGHLVFGTLHTTTAVSTVDRIIDQFPGDRQPQIRVMLSESLRGVIAQTLCQKVGGGRVAAREILLSIPAVSNLVREGKTYQIPSIMQTNRKVGMVTLNDSLLDLVERKLVEPKEAYMKSVDKASLENAMKAKGYALPFLKAAAT